MASLTAGVSKLQRLQRLSAEGKSEELQTAIMQCTCKELRSFIGLLGVPVRSKDYAVYNNKAGEKLWKMWRELCAAYTSLVARFEISGDPDAEFSTFCQSRADVYYLACWLNVKPHLLGSVNGKLTQNLSLSTPRVAESKDASTVATSEKSCDEISKTEQRAKLMKMIKDACKTLKSLREAGLGQETEDVVQVELERYKHRRYLSIREWCVSVSPKKIIVIDQHVLKRNTALFLHLFEMRCLAAWVK
ncbi:uncharacterized protein PITG_07206 [Phytophthora infestans T30-4]|uniref:Uncharacterized protein n=1 Tax=Phytophthora infestans (strain T30-4) TaxID=403677 RepID=D0N7I5_PHYIT|nr:uncharacterized protein PITG_07206 [Phytophthora infestans T30-4]EEY53534.1 hypothetical protein PITG_07206 [Phytophthora infestans T30-4]|eukprot:XP_002905152.1 hypothetical protein PITG_07206 [Phytophthora infestans T30-4]